ncbi:MAG: response regulator [Deltaproteobacteria bacterium]|nr:response regulator [Deltaproteobacteria bacterium]
MATLDKKDLKILVVDDNEDLRNLLTIQLKKMGFENLHTAIDGQEAYNNCISKLNSKEPFDAIISDMRMPKMTGLEFLKKIRENIHVSDTPFMIVTGHGDKEHVKEAITLKVDQFITRPYQEDMLEDKVMNLLGVKKSS